MADYNEKTVQELKDEAKARGLHGYSDKNKEELVALLEESEQGDGSSESDSATRDEDGQPTLGHDSEASDADNPDVVENLSPEGQEALDNMGEEEKELADLALDASGPLHLQDPSERVQGGAINEAHAKELEEKFGELPEDFVGNLREDGFVPGRDDEKREGSGPNGEVVQEDVIDFPPPLEELEQEKADLANKHTATYRSAPYVQHEAAREAFPDEGETIAKDRLYNQRAQLYTDGLSGQADHNTVLAYRTNDVRAASAESREDQRSEDRNEPDSDDNEE